MALGDSGCSLCGAGDRLLLGGNVVQVHLALEDAEAVRAKVNVGVDQAGDGGPPTQVYDAAPGLEERTQPLLWRAATRPDAAMENITQDWRGKVDFEDETITGNGRGLIQMADLGEAAARSINTPPLKKLDRLVFCFITRRHTVLPIVSRLAPEQAAAAFMLGESIETSAGDPRRGGHALAVA